LKYFLFLFVLGSGCDDATLSPLEYDLTCPGEGDYAFADKVVQADGEVQAPSAINVQENAVNGVRGNKGSGSRDVLSRGYDKETKNNILILEWEARTVQNVKGNDFVIFENVFEVGVNNNFMDPIVVSVSNDLVNWSTFPFDYLAADEERYQPDPKLWMGFAGVNATNYNSDDSACLDPLDPISGGDAFDLDDLPEGSSHRAGFRYLKMQSAPSIVNPDTNAPFVRDFISDGFDLDGVYAKKVLPLN